MKNEMGSNALTKLNQFERNIVKLEKIVNTSIFFFMIMLMFIQVVTRYLINYPLNWSEEMIRYLFIVSTYLGASIAIQQKASIEINIWPLIMEKFFQKETRRQKVDISIQILADTITILFIVLFCFLLVGFFHKLRCFGQVSPCLNLPIAIIVGGMVVSAVLMVFHYIVQVINNLSRY